jgi:hypothetical protein
MDTDMVTPKTQRKPGQRGAGKRAAMSHANLRLPSEVLAFYKTFPNFSMKMREVLAEYAQTKEQTHD